MIIDGPGALGGDLDIIGDVIFGRDPEIRYRVRASIMLVLLLIAYGLMPGHATPLRHASPRI
jgi:hypothetical protein